MATQQPIRVMLVDDSGVVRRMVSHILQDEDGLEVAAEAADGFQALERLQDPDFELDLLVLDVEMPGMDGLGVLAQLPSLRPDLPVVMFSAQTERAADLTLEALALGARDFACKPRANERDAATAQVKAELVERIRLHGRPAPEPPLPAPVEKTEPEPRDEPAAAEAQAEPAPPAAEPKAPLPQPQAPRTPRAEPAARPKAS